ncbi:MAG: hypothetical protein Q9157_003506 [Trypethelium eluteriae]
MRQLVGAVDDDDDWTGMTDRAARKKRQNRLNVRAYRKRKALAAKDRSAAPRMNQSDTPNYTAEDNSEHSTPCWIENEQAICHLPVSRVKDIQPLKRALLPRTTTQSYPERQFAAMASQIIFPLAPDHLITLVQYNVLRACLVNRELVFGSSPPDAKDCSSPALHPSATSSLLPEHLPPDLRATSLQLTVPHEPWIDTIPHPGWRDNLIRLSGTYDEDDLWSDTIGGLFEGFSGDESQRRGVIAWNPAWNIGGWEMGEGFWWKWGWTMSGCEGVLEATNRWRRMRGEMPLEHCCSDARKV